VGLKPVYVFDGAQLCEFPQYKAAVRLDLWGRPGCLPLGLVGNEYTPMQNRQAFGFFDQVVGTGEITYETAGALGNGERVWILARVKDDILVKGKDVLEQYLLLSNGHAGRTALQIRFTPVRVVCANTLSCALGFGQDILKMYHRRNLHQRVEHAQSLVQKILSHYSTLAADYERLAGKIMVSGVLKAYLQAVFPDPKRRSNQTERSYEEAMDRANTLRGASARLSEEGKGNREAPVRGTLWAAFNGVTEMVDHHLAYRSPSHWLDSILFGEGERIKSRAFDEALKMALN
jgi:phage/plasmid-like protein (TIGR03299 family)